jgi:hypothetical protein
MEGIFVFLGELLVQLVLNVAWYATGFGSLRPGAPRPAVNFALLLLGGGLGALSLLVFRFTIVPGPALRVAHLVLAPIACAFLIRALAKWRANENPNVVPREQFWGAFWFTLGWVLVRFTYARRG